MKSRIYYLRRLRPSVSGKVAGQEKEERIRRGLADWVLFRQYWQNNDSPAILAESIDITGDELNGFLKGTFGERYMAIRRRLRIDDACEIMLKNPSMPIHMAGRIVGINDRSDFRKAFVTEKGCTPSVWKKYGGSRQRIWVTALLGKAQNHFRSLHKS